MTEELKPASERVSTWGFIIVGNIWMTCDVQPLGFIVGAIALILAALIVWDDHRTAPSGATGEQP